ncbi:putative membrane protein [Lachnellula occidentalis]|uniref:Putative membrane protein n=1 Tax=Lachnellula occidentalis TaxID=215460 RepID=A0A8H8RHY0_9HELO|nr:putative membrane protein [Lachnellula occidentalis]
MQILSRSFAAPTVVVLLGLASVAGAHGHEGDMKMDIGDTSISRPALATKPDTMDAGPQSYFQYGEHSGFLVAHILLMILGWMFILPVGVMFSISRSRYRLPVQILFLVTNAVGVLLVTIYNASTPDLYPDNAHHKIGWILTWVMSAQVFMGVLNTYKERNGVVQNEERAAFIPISTQVMAEHQRLQNLRLEEACRFSNDSGQGTEPNTESLRSQSISSQGSDDQLPDIIQLHEQEEELKERSGWLRGSKLDQFLSRKAPRLLTSRVFRVFQLAYNIVDRVIFLIGFLGMATGFITYGGFFIGPQVFSGLAHFIKGGVFFWYGILTLGRWAGSFADIGWAWNISPSKKSRPTAEFVESFLIFLYGSTNVFLEHLAAWGSKWSAQDLEHISITIMFIGGGLCGMVIESRNIRDLLNTARQPPQSFLHDHGEESEKMEPKTYRFSMNPMPALVVLLLGLMMSSHHQASMLSTMIHKQWGTLLVGAAFARAATYVVFYLSPPTSILPGRPPTELITAFCLMAGGLIFMSSARDLVMAMELHDLDAMFVFTVSMGFITFLMAWIILVVAIKGWAVRMENRSIYTYRPISVA